MSRRLPCCSLGALLTRCPAQPRPGALCSLDQAPCPARPGALRSLDQAPCPASTRCPAQPRPGALRSLTRPRPQYEAPLYLVVLPADSLPLPTHRPCATHPHWHPHTGWSRPTLTFTPSQRPLGPHPYCLATPAAASFPSSTKAALAPSNAHIHTQPAPPCPHPYCLATPAAASFPSSTNAAQHQALTFTYNFTYKTRFSCHLARRCSHPTRQSSQRIPHLPAVSHPLCSPSTFHLRERDAVAPPAVARSVEVLPLDGHVEMVAAPSALRSTPALVLKDLGLLCAVQAAHQVSCSGGGGCSQNRCRVTRRSVEVVAVPRALQNARRLVLKDPGLLWAEAMRAAWQARYRSRQVGMLGDAGGMAAQVLAVGHPRHWVSGCKPPAVSRHALAARMSAVRASACRGRVLHADRLLTHLHKTCSHLATHPRTVDAELSANARAWLHGSGGRGKGLPGP
eukprot:366057-Chlamydomonas_euryale.AAC.2